jgi:hypothetical protein
MNNIILENNRLYFILTITLSGRSLRKFNTPLREDAVLLYFVTFKFLAVTHSGSVIGSSIFVISRT